MLYSSLHYAALHSPRQTAVVSGKDSLTYVELWERSNLLAQMLVADGVKPGARVVILGPNSIDTVIAWWATLKCHAICVYLSESLKPSGFEYIVRDVSPSHYLCGSSLSRKLLSENVSFISLDTIDWSASNGLEYALALPSDLDLIASIVYTSGSTGQPKGVCLTHKNLLSSGEMTAVGHNLTHRDNYLMVVPLHYVHGQMMLMSLTLRGARLEFMTNFVFPTAVTKKIKDQEITCLSGVPYHFAMLINRGKFLTTELPSLRWMGITGGAMNTESLLELAKSKPTVEIHIGYGQTECSPRITRLDPKKLIHKPSSIGSVEPGLVVEILDVGGMPVAEGETGELVVSGPSVMQGYWNDPASTAKVIDAQGRLHTGDLAYRDSEGDIFIRGRCQAMIKSAGERIFPEELEAVLRLHPYIADVAVVGEKDDTYGQIVIAHVVLHESNNSSSHEQLKAIEGYCLDHFTFAKAPRHYQLWSEFPYKENGKVDKQRLHFVPVASRLLA